MFLQTFFVISIRVSPIQHTFVFTNLVIMNMSLKLLYFNFEFSSSSQPSKQLVDFIIQYPNSNGQQHQVHSCNTQMYSCMLSVWLINSKLRNNNQNASSTYLYRTSSKADLIWKVKDGSCPNCFYWHQEFLPFSDANKLMGIILLKE